MQFLPNPNAQGSGNLMLAVLICLGILLVFEGFKPRPELPTDTDTAAIVTEKMAPEEKNPLTDTGAPTQTDLLAGQKVLLSLNGFNVLANGSVAPTNEAAAVVPEMTLAWNTLPADILWGKASEAEGAAIQTQHNGATYTRSFYPDTTGEGLTLVEKVQAGDNGLALTHKTTLQHTGEHLPDETSSWVNHFGPLAVLDGQRYESDYSDLKKRSVQLNASRGFAGFSSQYLLGAVVLQNQNAQVTQKQLLGQGVQQQFVTEVISPVIAVQPNAEATLTRVVYVGDKSRAALVAVDEQLADAVHFGWFHGIALPLYTAMAWVHERTGNVILAILAVTLLLKLITLPLTWKSTVAMGKMKMLQPKMKHLQERYKDDRTMLSMEMMKLYKVEKLNPFGGCWPVLIQIPLFFAMYKVILIGHMFKGEPFFWIADIATRDPYFILPLVMGAAMYFQMKLNPQAGSDPMQKQLMTYMPIIMTALFLFFPAALMIYWIANTLLSIIQQVFIYKRLGYYK